MHVVRGLIESGPQAIQSAFELYEKVPQHEWTASDWENIYETSEFYAREFDEDLNTLIKRTVGLIGNNYRATEQAGGGDLNSAFVASALGTNAMDRARSSLSEERIGEFSKAELLAMGDRPLYSVNEDSGYAGPDMSAFGEIERANAPVERLSESQIRSWMGQFNGDVEKEADLIMEAYKAQMREGGPGTMPDRAAVVGLARERVAKNYSQFLPPDMFAQMGFVRQYMPSEAPEQLVETPQAPVGMSMGETVGGPVAPVPEAPASTGGFSDVPPQYVPTHEGGADPFAPAPPSPAPTNQLGDLLTQFSDMVKGGGISDQRPKGQEGLSAEGVDTSRVRRFFENTFGRIGNAFTGRGGASDTRQ
jgi:hypothetical protein